MTYDPLSCYHEGGFLLETCMRLNKEKRDLVEIRVMENENHPLTKYAKSGGAKGVSQEEKDLLVNQLILICFFCNKCLNECFIDIKTKDDGKVILKSTLNLYYGDPLAPAKKHIDFIKSLNKDDINELACYLAIKELELKLTKIWIEDTRGKEVQDALDELSAKMPERVRPPLKAI